jgi:hypothetical protein
VRIALTLALVVALVLVAAGVVAVGLVAPTWLALTIALFALAAVNAIAEAAFRLWAPRPF